MTNPPAQKSGSEALVEPPKLMFAFDPGKATGWAIFQNGILRNMGISRSVEDFDTDLDQINETWGIPQVIVVENFRLMRSKALQQSGSELEAVQVIGMLKRQARKWEAKYVDQAPSIMPIAIKYSKMPLPKNHRNSHHFAAANHGIYYLVKNRMVLPVGLR